MPIAKRSIESKITVDGLSLTWHLQREQQIWSTEENWKGIAIHVRVVEGKFRELLLEYPVVVPHKVGYTKIKPVLPIVPAAKVAAHIRAAIAAGWDPGSRGKPFVYQVEELPN